VEAGAHFAAGMTLKTLREMRDAVPFKPFEIHLADGRVLSVVTTDHLFFMPKSPEFLVVLPDGGFRFVDSAQVVSVGRGPTQSTARTR
jgi:hypothetical protein